MGTPSFCRRGRCPLRAHALVALLAVAAGVRARPASAADVAVLMSADVDAYRQAVAGFEKASGHRIVSLENMNGPDMERGRQILDGFVQARPDLILAVGVWALQAVAEVRPPIRVVYTMVLNPASIVGAGPADVTGSSMNVPAEAVLDVVAELGTGVRRVGVIYNPRTTGFLIRRAQDLAEARRLELVARPVATPVEALAAVDDLEGDDLDIVWVLPDADTLGEKVIDRLLLFSYRKGVPLLGVSEAHARKGAALALSFASSEDIGRQAGELSRRPPGSAQPGGTDFTMVRETSLFVNLKAARKLQLEMPESLVARAAVVIR